MTFAVEVYRPDRFGECCAMRIAGVAPPQGSLALTGGTTAERIYSDLARQEMPWQELHVFFSDERCVPPDHEASNFGMADRLLLSHVTPQAVHRIRGEIDPEEAAAEYEGDLVVHARDGFDLLLLGMGADAHIAALAPGSPTLDESKRLAVPVDRSDGLKGVTLAAAAITAAKKILLLVAGETKAEAVSRAVTGDERPKDCPARLLADHPDATFLLDETAAARL